MPTLSGIEMERPSSLAVAVAASETAIEAAPSERIDGGDAVIRRMIQPGSGVEFRTLKVGEGGNTAMVVLFCRSEAIEYLVSSGAEKDEAEADARLKRMQHRRVIEEIDLDELTGGKGHAISASGPDSRKETSEIRFRFVDPWEVEALESKEGEVLGASLGREHYLAFNVGIVTRSCEEILRSLGGLHLLGLWSHSKGGICLTKAIASVHPPWERDSGCDLEMKRGALAEASPYTNSIRQHLYRNSLFRHLGIPQRFLALIQVELLDLKNLTSPGGSSSLNAYALLRLKRPGSGAPLTHKARTLDSACTQPTKIGKSTGPNAPASWGSLVRFRFPLPEDVNCDGVSFDRDREALFKGAPSVLQLSVYEKKFMSDLQLGGADVKLDALTSGGQLEEWVPLRAGKDVISWFARIRLTLRFEILCLNADDSDLDIDSDRCPSVGLRKIKELSQLGGAHEASKGFKKSVSTPDLLSYFESMVY
uniref:C2 domain-containing protein n=1 Tax=Helicotheca tamesis TaxID=374047 RepID=A0A7S2MKE5_9STRA